MHLRELAVGSPQWAVGSWHSKTTELVETFLVVGVQESPQPTGGNNFSDKVGS